MMTSRLYKIIIAETAPIILAGISEILKKIRDFHPKLIEIDSRDSLLNTISSDTIDLLIINPSFGGLLHPDDIRKTSLNPDLKIIAIELGKLNKTTISLYDDNFHITDDAEEIRNKINSVVKIDVEDSSEKDNLSTREKEIISHVVKGFTNQEIAEKLFLSIHTVMTHRRNIARKLQIHSATGLTIYAIVNKIVDLSEIKL